MSVPDNEMNEDYVRRLTKEELCRWLEDNGGLSREKLKAVRKAVEELGIDGTDFLDYTLQEWVDVFGATNGVAHSLNRIAKRFQKSATPENQLNDDAVVRLAGEELESEMIEALTCDVGETGKIPGDCFSAAFDVNSMTWEGLLDTMNDFNGLTQDEEEISELLMKVYGKMLVDDKFCLAQNGRMNWIPPSEMLRDSCLGFFCVNFILLRYSNYYCRTSPLRFNNNTEWVPPHIFQKGKKSDYYKWKPKCDAALSFGDVVDFECLLVFAEHSRFVDDKDIDKIKWLFTASAQTIREIVDDQNLVDPFFLFCFSFQECYLRLHVMKATHPKPIYYENVKTFDCATSKGCREAVDCCWMIAKYAFQLAERIRELSKNFKPPPKVKNMLNQRKTFPSFRKSQSSTAKRSSSEQPSPSKKQKSETRGIHHAARLAEVKHVLSSSGEFYDVRPMFETGVVYSTHIEINPDVDRILTATYGNHREAVIVKKVSPSEFDYVKKLKQNVHSLTKSPQSIGFLFPESFKDYGDSMKFLVFKKVRPLSSLYFDDLVLVEKIYKQLFKFLRFCQAHQIVHGDLKLSNLGLDKENILCVFDWEERVNGTEGYMAPEVSSKSTKPNVLSDIYSAGILLKEIVDKASRFKGTDQGRLQMLRLAISSMLAREPEKRELVDLESTKLTGSDTSSAAEESGSSCNVVPEKRPRMDDLSHADGGYNMISTYQQ